MDFSMNGLSIDEAKRIDILAYLSSLGHQATKNRGADFWYLSPLRVEKTPSFKINVNLNRWYDSGLGKGGSVIGFCLLYFDSTIPDIIQNLSGSLVLLRSTNYGKEKGIDDQSRIKVIDEFEPTSYALICYLKQLGIALDIAVRYCKEIRYQLYDKTWYGIGFKNDLGGYEIRNRYFKARSSPKGITTIQNDYEKVSVLEGFFDFLSYPTIHAELVLAETDYVILNSLSSFEKARPLLECYQKINLYLDNNKAGRNCSSYALSLCGKYKDNSSLYKDHEDLNDFLVNGFKGNGTETLPQPRLP